MSKNNIVVREIKPEDNGVLEQIIRDIFHEFNMPLTGTVYEDEDITHMYDFYQGKDEVYYVIVVDGNVVGGAGIKKLEGLEGAVCELQKMYFSPVIRGKGLGKRMLEKCLKTAKVMGYEQCYLESASNFESAIKMYNKYGFKNLRSSLGDTGHFSCGVWMIKDL